MGFQNIGNSVKEFQLPRRYLVTFYEEDMLFFQYIFIFTSTIYSVNFHFKYPMEPLLSSVNQNEAEERLKRNAQKVLKICSSPRG
jgi:hypothetical protein